MGQQAFGDEMFARMRQRKIKGVQLAQLTGINQGSISEYATGKRVPGPRNVERIALALRWPLQDALHAAGFHKSDLEGEEKETNDPPPRREPDPVDEIAVIMQNLRPQERRALASHLRDVARSWVSSFVDKLTDYAVLSVRFLRTFIESVRLLKPIISL